MAVSWTIIPHLLFFNSILLTLTILSDWLEGNNEDQIDMDYGVEDPNCFQHQENIASLIVMNSHVNTCKEPNQSQKEMDNL